MSINLKNELSLINKKMDALQDEYRIKIKAFASDSNTSSSDLEDIYNDNTLSYKDEDEDGDLVDIYYLDYGLECQLSSNINTPKYILEEILTSEFYSSNLTNTAVHTLARQSLLIAQDRQSTTQELNEVYLWLADTYLALSKHPNSSTKVLESLVEHKDIDMYINIVNHNNVTPKILDKMSCIYDEVDDLILKHPKIYAKTKKKINRKR